MCLTLMALTALADFTQALSKYTIFTLRESRDLSDCKPFMVAEDLMQPFSYPHYLYSFFLNETIYVKA